MRQSSPSSRRRHSPSAPRRRVRRHSLRYDRILGLLGGILLLIILARTPILGVTRSLTSWTRHLLQGEWVWIAPQTFTSPGFQEIESLFKTTDSPAFLAFLAANQQTDKQGCTPAARCLKQIQETLQEVYQTWQNLGIHPRSAVDLILHTLDLEINGIQEAKTRFPQSYQQQQKQQGGTEESVILAARLATLSSTANFSLWGCPPGEITCLEQQQMPSLIALNQTMATYLPMVYFYPTEGILSQGFHPYHEGIDIANEIGTPIHAAAPGQVIFSGWDAWGLGNAIKIRHRDGSFTVYGHNQDLLVSVGEWVGAGQKIATMGNTGNSTGPHLHLEIRAQGVAQNPLEFLSERRFDSPQ